MMIPFVFAVHAHQPVGNFDWVFEKACNSSYRPFLETLQEFPDLKVAVHYSGSLLEWIESNDPGHVELLKGLVERGQVEILGGAFYEPILPSIPERDARAQIESYSNHLEELFGMRPRGIWLAERVWDPCLPRLLSGLGVDYTLVDDTHFHYAGMKPSEVWGPHITEREGKSMTVFPIDQKLRYLIPFADPSETIEHIRKNARVHPGFVSCYGDDTEKFGMWPETYEWVYEKGWLRRFFSALTEVKDEICTMHFSDYLAEAGPRERVYLPPASYEEMMEWVLPTDMGSTLENFVNEIKDQGRMEELSPFVRGGHWDMFLAKYEESNTMHKRMLLASERIARRPRTRSQSRPLLFRSQCNCAYWHGVFGGLYLNYLRHAVFEKILEAEEKTGMARELRMEEEDYNADGFPEIIVTSPHINAFIHPACGGAVRLIEYPPAHFELSNIMSRRPEHYHDKLKQAALEQGSESPATIHERVVKKEEGLENYLVYDRYPRMSFQEHLVPPSLSLEEIEKERTIHLGSFAGSPYQVIERNEDRIKLSRRDFCGEQPVRVEKTYSFLADRAGFTTSYVVASEGERQVSLRFCVELNLSLLSGDDPSRYYRVDGEKTDPPEMNSRGTSHNAEKIELVNEHNGFVVSIRASRPALLFRYPIEAVSQSESGFERTYQGSCLWFTFEISLEPGSDLEFSLDFECRNI
ncbi:MAG: alpha-amylase/4-alpha-glucanotransferase domain-containing protein [bacterium]